MSVETPEFAAMVRRMIRAHGRRVGNGDYPDLADLVAMRDVLEDAIAEAVAGMRAQTPACSWREIGEGLGTTKQYAQARYGRGHVSAVGSRDVSERKTG